jgi:hypothetical protein
MKIQLHILTRPLDASKAELLESIRREPGVEVRVVDLTGSRPDYLEVVKQVFEADSVVTW